MVTPTSLSTSITAGQTGHVAWGNTVSTAVNALTNATTGAVGRGDIVVNVRDSPYNAAGDGVTLDTTAINAAITANPGRTIFLPKTASGIYLINAAANVGQKVHNVGIQLNQPGTRILMDRGVTLKVQPTSSTRYAAIEITAADCTVEGGTILGDVGFHTGATSEWGYGVLVNSGGNRATVRDLKATKCWGDGIMVGDGNSFTDADHPTDVRILNVICDDNRRNGLSVCSATNIQIIGGSFINSGLTAFTAPGAGIALEPNPGGLQAVTNAIISGVVAKGNAGRGIYTHAQALTTTATITCCRAVGNTADGFCADSTSRVQFISCLAQGNTGDGFIFPLASSRTEATACTATGNTGIGFNVNGDSHTLTSCIARDNAKAGYYIVVTATNLTLSNCNSTGNCTAGAFLREFECFAPGVKFTACVADVGLNGTKATVGFGIRSGATTNMLTGCAARGAFATAPYQGQTDTIAYPIPGTAKAAAITTPTSDTVGTKAAIDAIRVALTAYGITA